MKRKVVNWKWEDKDSQKSFLEWQGMPNDEDTNKEVMQIENLLGIAPTLKVIDIGCGTGRQTIAFAKKGYNIIGIDVAESYLEIAKTKAKELDLEIHFEQKRGSEMSEKETYDLAIAFNHTPGFFDRNELKEHFRKIFDSLKENGKLFIKTAGPKIIPSTNSDKVKNWTEKDGKFILSEKYIEDGFRNENCIVIDYLEKEITEYKEKQRAFSFEEEVAYLKEAGFKKIKCYSDLEGCEATEYNFGIYCCFK